MKEKQRNLLPQIHDLLGLLRHVCGRKERLREGNMEKREIKVPLGPEYFRIPTSALCDRQVEFEKGLTSRWPDRLKEDIMGEE